MGSGWQIDRDDILGTNCLLALGKLLARTNRLEAMLREGAEVSIHPDRLPRQVVLAAQHLRDWELNAEAAEMTDVWDKFYSEWTSSTADYDESLPNLLSKTNQWLGDRLKQWMVSAGCTLDELEGNGDSDEISSNPGETAISSQGGRKRRKISRLPERTENEIRGAIKKALDDQKHGIPVKTRSGRVTKAEVAKHTSVGAEYIKNSEEWRFYGEHGYVRPREEPSEAEREAAAKLLNELLPHYPHLDRRIKGMEENNALEYIGKLTRMLVPVTKLPEVSQIDNGHEALKQFSDEKAEMIHPLVTDPGENTPAVARFDTVPEDD